MRKVVWLALLALAATLQPAHALRGPLDDIGMPVWSYDGLGWAAGQNGKLIVIARQGSRHKNDPTGRIVRYQWINGTAIADPIPLIDEQMKDERSVSGGFSRSGAMIIFYARQRITMCDPPTACREPWYENWDGIRVARIDKDGSIISSPIPTGRDGYYSPHGPLVVLPSGRLMLTAYGYNRADGWRVWAIFSNDDGRTWGEETLIDISHRERPSESAAAWVAGKTDDTSKLIMVSRLQRQNGIHAAYTLMQYVSNDGGRHWAKRGNIAGSATPGGAIPWIMKFDGRLALAWVDRGPKTVRVSVAKWQDVFDHADAWPVARTIYQSILQDKNNGSDFGYPSLGSIGPEDSDKFVVFYDSHTGANGSGPYQIPSDVDLHAVPLF